MVRPGLSRWRPALLRSRCSPVHPGFQYPQTPVQNRAETGRHLGKPVCYRALYSCHSIAYQHHVSTAYQGTKGTSRVRRTYVSIRYSYSSIHVYVAHTPRCYVFYVCTLKFVVRMWQVRYAVHTSHVRRTCESNVAGTP